MNLRKRLRWYRNHSEATRLGLKVTNLYVCGKPAMWGKTAWAQSVQHVTIPEKVAYHALYGDNYLLNKSMQEGLVPSPYANHDPYFIAQLLNLLTTVPSDSTQIAMSVYGLLDKAKDCLTAVQNFASSKPGKAAASAAVGALAFAVSRDVIWSASVASGSFALLGGSDQESSEEGSDGGSAASGFAKNCLVGVLVVDDDGRATLRPAAREDLDYIATGDLRWKSTEGCLDPADLESAVLFLLIKTEAKTSQGAHPVAVAMSKVGYVYALASAKWLKTLSDKGNLGGFPLLGYGEGFTPTFTTLLLSKKDERAKNVEAERISATQTAVINVSQDHSQEERAYFIRGLNDYLCEPVNCMLDSLNNKLFDHSESGGALKSGLPASFLKYLNEKNRSETLWFFTNNKIQPFNHAEAQGYLTGDLFFLDSSDVIGSHPKNSDGVGSAPVSDLLKYTRADGSTVIGYRDCLYTSRAKSSDRNLVYPLSLGGYVFGLDQETICSLLESSRTLVIKREWGKNRSESLSVKFHGVITNGRRCRLDRGSFDAVMSRLNWSLQGLGSFTNDSYYSNSEGDSHLVSLSRRTSFYSADSLGAVVGRGDVLIHFKEQTDE